MRVLAVPFAAIFGLGMLVTSAPAQTSEEVPHLQPRNGVATTEAKRDSDSRPPVTVPSGTRIPLTLKQGVNTKNARPGDPVYAPLLLGLGIDGLSMSPAWLPSVKYLVRAMTMADARALAAEALSLSSPKEIHARCDAFTGEERGACRLIAAEAHDAALKELGQPA